ncbi:MAG: trypsin-like peptidase domain-containing protein [Bacteroidetes bacterium]|nr:trypsin-like peptidase domain-containing protein [Bacteroidota bacterium]
MYNYPPNNFLYTSYRIEAIFSNGEEPISPRMATGFVLEIGNGIPFIITNRHVIELDYKQQTPKYKDFKLVELKLTSRRQNDTEYSININPETEFCFHDNIENDVVIIKPLSLPSETNIFHYHFNLEHLANEEKYKDILPYDLICFTGFPNTHDKLMGRPILRTGTIASDPNFEYSWDKNSHGNCVAYEGFSTEGASGSPIFAPPRGMLGIPNSRDGYLIGINAGHIPEKYGHSAISYFYKSTIIHQIIEKYKLSELPAVEKAK